MAERFKVNRGRARCCQGWTGALWDCPLGVLNDGSGSHSSAHFVVREVMKMLWVVEHFPPWGLGSDVLIRQRHHSRYISSQDDENGRGPSRTAIAVFFGMFRAEEVMLPLPIPPGRSKGVL